MITSAKMLGILIDHTTRTAAPRRARRHSWIGPAWIVAVLGLLYFLARMS